MIKENSNAKWRPLNVCKFVVHCSTIFSSTTVTKAISKTADSDSLVLKGECKKNVDNTGLESITSFFPSSHLFNQLITPQSLTGPY